MKKSDFRIGKGFSFPGLLAAGLVGVLLSGCEVLQPAGGGESASSRSLVKKSAPQIEKGGGYLSRAKPGQLKVAGSDVSELDLDADVSKGELMVRYRQMEKGLKVVKKEKDTLRKELDLSKEEHQAEVLRLEAALDSEKRETDHQRDKAVAAEFRSMESKQNLERIKLDLLMKREIFQSSYPIYYEVVRGDNLWNIAARKNIYSNAYKWTELYYANRAKIEDKNAIFPGQVLHIPRYFEMVLDGFESELGQMRMPAKEMSDTATPVQKASKTMADEDAEWDDIL